MLLLEMVEESDTSVSEESERLQLELSEDSVGRRAEAREDEREEVREGAGLADARLHLLTVRTLLRIRLRLISTTSTEGGSTALGMILDRYVAWGEMYITGLGGF